MTIELKQQLRLTQQLVMTPQLQQAIRLLQLSQLELVDMVQQELQENPVLEEVSESEEERRAVEERRDGEVPLETEARDGAAAPDGTEAPDSTAAEASAGPEPSDAEKIEDIDWQSYIDSYPQTAPTVIRDDDERRSIEATHSRRETLAEHLEWQLHLSNFDDREQLAAQWIIGNLDDHGYVKSDLDEISRQSGVPLEVVEKALKKVQTFDPTGVAARDLRECLMLQLHALKIDAPLVVALVDAHLDALQRRDFRGIAHALGATIEEVAAAAKVVANLEPRPGRPFGGDEPIYIEPDIHVCKVGDDFHIVLNEDGLPKLRVSNLYRDVLTRGEHVAKDTRDYVRDKMRSALWLIKSIHQRQRTIYKVMQSIIKQQREFFDNGINYLKPLNLRDVAEDIEMHESTVSRVTTNKYVDTPQGIFELKYFFNSSINRFDGEAIASESVKEKIRRVVTNEDPRRPLSDQRIAEMLKASNIDIARRTVTKYREAMNILSSTKRRQII
jgi:RNA polymerase sigma-54 factor